MRKVLSATVVAAGALIATHTSAQVLGVDLNGRYQCMALCPGAPGSLAFITQNGWEFNVVNDAGQPSRGWVDWPGHIWVARAQLGAIYSLDGLTIQFDSGTIWQRFVEPPLPPRVQRRR